MERENSRNDFAFLARIEAQPRTQYQKDIVPQYDAVTRYMEEPMTYQHRRTGVEREDPSAQGLGPSLRLDVQQQHEQRYWRAPEVDGLFAGIGCWADEFPREESKM